MTTGSSSDRSAGCRRKAPSIRSHTCRLGSERGCASAGGSLSYRSTSVCAGYDCWTLRAKAILLVLNMSRLMSFVHTLHHRYYVTMRLWPQITSQWMRCTQELWFPAESFPWLLFADEVWKWLQISHSRPFK